MAEEFESAEVDSASQVQAGEAVALPQGKLYPLNSRRLVATYLRQIAEALHLPTSGSVDEVRQLIEGKLSETRDVSNVQVVVAEATLKEVKLSLVDDDGVFVETPPVSRLLKETNPEELRYQLGEALARTGDLEAELAAVNEELEGQKAEVDRLSQELADAGSREDTGRLTSMLAEQKEKSKRLWKMNCQQAAEQEKLLEEKDAEIARLRRRLTDLKTAWSERESDTLSSETSSHSGGESPGSRKSHGSGLLGGRVKQEPVSPGRVPGPELGGASIAVKREPGEETPGTEKKKTVKPEKVTPKADPASRRGKAPPINQFSGEDADFRFEDWLPSLERAAEWNGWTETEKLIQLAGHLKGKALQEWNLLTEDEKCTYQEAVERLRDVLGPGSRVLAAQDFRHTSQEDSETVAAFIRRLERAFRLAHGCDKMKSETRDIFLHGQLQEGLRYDLIKSPSVSGALTYKELCVAAKNEEKRLVQLKKRQQFASHKGNSQTGPRNAHQPKKTSDHSGTNPSKPQMNPPLTKPALRCYICNKVGHRARDCHARKTESSGDKQQKSGVKQITTTDPPKPEPEKDDPRSYLQSDSEGDSQVQLIKVVDKGSKSHRAQVLVQGVPAQGLIDTGADITIIGGELFKTVATVNKLKKSQFRKADKIARSYNKEVIPLDGRIDLELAFDDKAMTTPIYVKMDSEEQLLLGEGVCRQLGIVTYHPDVLSTDQKSAEGSDPTVRVPAVQVRLTQTQSVLPQQAICVPVEMVGGCPGDRMLLVEPDPTLAEEGIELFPSLVRPGEQTTVVISNSSGFTCHLEPGQSVGRVEVVEEVPAAEEDCPDAVAPEVMVAAVMSSGDVMRREKIVEIFGSSLEQLDLSGMDLPVEAQQQLLQVLQDHHESFCLEEHERGETDLIQLEIDTGEASPRKQRARRMPFAVREEVSRQLKKMLESGVIQPSCSPWASPVVLVRKQDGSHRFCVDYRQLNSVTKADTFPLPRVDDMLDQLGRARYFSTLDLASGYWQIRVHRNSQEKTAFVTHEGLHEFRVMPFGLTNAPAIFQRLMQQVLMGLNPEDGPPFVSVYIDDIIVFSTSWEEHLLHLKLVLERLRECNLKLKPVKCRFLRREVQYLGYVVTPEGLKTSQSHIQAILEFPTPTSVQEVRRFLGLASFYRRFVASFAKTAHPLHALTRKSVPFMWSGECEAAFRRLQEKLTTAPVLSYPDFEKKFIVETDASIQGLGAVVSQHQEDGKLHPIAYASRSLTAAEKNYGITELETLAVVWAISHFRAYLYGSSVIVYTDHSAVRQVLLNPQATGKHARWWTKVYSSGLKDIEIVYRAGKDNACADALSRSPQAPSPEEGIAETETQVLLTQVIDVHNVESLLEISEPGDVMDQALSLDEQGKDSALSEIIGYLQKDELPDDEKRARQTVAQSDLFSIVDNVLYYVEPHGKRRQRVVVPTHLKQQIMAEVHGGQFGGHFSGNRLYRMLCAKWWWKGMHGDCVRYCRSCPDCAFVSGGGRTGKPPLHPIPVSRPFQILGIDIMELPKTDRGNRYVLVMQDFLTKFPFVYPMPDQTALRIARILVEEVVPIIGVPEALLSDRGTNLLSHLMADVCKLLGIEKLNTTAYHPQCDGLTERFNRTLKTMLRKHAAKYSRQWDLYLHGVLWAYRNVPHEATGEKPSYLLFGIDCRTPTEAAFVPADPLTSADVQDYREELTTNLFHARELAVESVQKAQTRYKQGYDRDRKTKPLPYKVGDWVLIKYPPEETGSLRKLSRPWYGPYRITALTGTGITAVKVYAPQDGNIQVHASRVTRCPPSFPAGSYWYGNRKYSRGRPPRWVDQLMQDSTPEDEDQASSEEQDEPEATPSLVPDEEPPEEPPVEPSRPTRTRTRTVQKPDYFGRYHYY